MVEIFYEQKQEQHLRKKMPWEGVWRVHKMSAANRVIVKVSWPRMKYQPFHHQIITENDEDCPDNK